MACSMCLATRASLVAANRDIVTLRERAADTRRKLRSAIATAALQGLLANSSRLYSTGTIASEARYHADALLEELDK